MLEKKEIRITLRLLTRNPLSIAGGIITVWFFSTAIAISLTGSRFLPHDPDAIMLSNALSPPSMTYWFGTDPLGRDIFSRVMMATPIDASIAVVIVGVSLVVGVMLGSMAGYVGSKLDEIIMRTTDVFMAFPALVLALAVAVGLGPGIIPLVEALLIVWWPWYVRLARGETLSVRENQYIEGARAAGLSTFRIVTKHVIPNLITPVLVYASLDLGYVILTTSVLSYLGLGAQPPQSEWGRMVFDGQPYLSTAWWVPILPGVMILIVVLGFSLLGDGLRDVLDPKSRK